LIWIDDAGFKDLLSLRDVFVILSPAGARAAAVMIYSWFKLAFSKYFVFLLLLSSLLSSISSTNCELVFKSKLVFLSSKMHTLNTEWGYRPLYVYGSWESLIIVACKSRG